MAPPDGTFDVRVAFSADPPPTCANCGAAEFSVLPDGGSYCDNCGVRRPAGRDHAEADLGAVAGVSDIGNRHHHNEDGFSVAAFPSAYVGVVCDGVSSSNRPDTASHAAAEAAIRTFVRLLRTDPAEAPDADLAEVAMVAAAGAAQAAAAEVGMDANAERRRTPGNPPSSTFVAAVVGRDAVTVGWIGDSRAYWVGDDGSAARLTVDDTLGGPLAAAGVDVADDAPNAAALIRWLGADAADTAPHVAAFLPESPGRVIVCSDGLYRYAPDAEDMSAVVGDLTAGTQIQTVRALVGFALDAGGVDNVTVVSLPYPPGLAPQRS